jgi:VIT1/CCC1 family predicted Fe2+/Mn2+ transporter
MREPTADSDHHDRVDPHRPGTALADVILGGQDGLVNVLGVILGVAAATGSARVVLAAGLAATFAESVSMAAVAYTSRVAAGEQYESELARERRHVRAVPALEREEVRAIYAAKGFEGELLDRIVATITADEEVWVAVMMAEEHRLAAIDRRASVRAALVVGLAAIVGSLVPLAPFLFFDVGTGSWVSIGVAAAVLFAFGAYKARVTVGSPWKSGAEMALIGTVSALVGWVVGAVMRVPT